MSTWRPKDPNDQQPMKAVTAAELPADESGWAYEIRWDGMRLLAFVNIEGPGSVRLGTPLTCSHALRTAAMPKTIQIRDIDDDIYTALARRAAEVGMTVPELLRREAARLAARPTVEEWLARTRRRPSDISRAEVLEAFDELQYSRRSTSCEDRGRMLIVDATCLFEVVADTPHAEPIRARLAADHDQAAPHVVDVEVLNVVRRHEREGRLDATAAAQAIEDLNAWPGDRFGHRALLRRAWELRHDVRGWDAFYVALAEALDGTVLTLDHRLARATGATCPIEVVTTAKG